MTASAKKHDKEWYIGLHKSHRSDKKQSSAGLTHPKFDWKSRSYFFDTVDDFRRSTGTDDSVLSTTVPPNFYALVDMKDGISHPLIE